jgi:hypothetical protein
MLSCDMPELCLFAMLRALAQLHEFTKEVADDGKRLTWVCCGRSLGTVADFKRLAAAAGSDVDFRKKLLLVLEFSEATWEKACVHANKAVEVPTCPTCICVRLLRSAGVCVSAHVRL